MLNVDLLCQSFQEIIGWPYKTPGTNDKNGIDCSGAFVRAYKAQNASIYHGSNTIYRQYCGVKGIINNVSVLQPGVAVFKHRTDGNEPDKYKNDGIGNMYHIGLVVSVSPLKIIHATTPVAKMDTTLGNWSYYGFLSDVNYASEPVPSVEKTVIVTASSVNMRKTPAGEYMLRIPGGTTLSISNEVTQNNILYGETAYDGYHGWIDMTYVTEVDSGSEDAPDDSGDTVSIILPITTAQALLSALQEALGQ